MKQRCIEPIWAIIFGFIIAPVMCALNASVAASLFGSDSGSFSQLVLVFSFPVFTWPLGLMTYGLLHFWNAGYFRRARLISLGCGLVSATFWAWIETVYPLQFDSPEVIGGLLLPFLWSIGFFVFAFCARPSKN